MTDRNDYETVLKDHRRLVRELDVAMNGKKVAAKQASLCDLIEPARRMRARIEHLEKLVEKYEYRLLELGDF